MTEVISILLYTSSVQLLSHVWLFATPRTAAHQAFLSITNSQNLPKIKKCPSSRWCHPAISFSVIPFSSHLQSFPASGFFPVNQFFTAGVQSIGVSASASVLPMNIQDCFLLAVQGTLKSLLQHHSLKASIFQHSASIRVLLSHPYMTTGKIIALARQTFVSKVMNVSAF